MDSIVLELTLEEMLLIAGAVLSVILVLGLILYAFTKVVQHQAGWMTKNLAAADRGDGKFRAVPDDPGVPKAS